MHLSRVEDEFMHKVDKEIDKDTVCVKRMGDNKVPMYKEKSPARDTADQDQIQIVTEDEGDSGVPMYEEKSLARRQKGTQTVYLCRVEDESDKRVLMYLPWGDLPAESPTPITKPASTAGESSLARR